MKRNIVSVVLGLVAAIAVFLLTEKINGIIHPAPGNINLKDINSINYFYENQPLRFWLFVLAGWILGSSLCGFLIKLLSQNENKKLPMIAGSILTLSAIVNFFSLPHPTWFIIIGLLIFIPSTLIGHSIYKIK